jgi:hypothetical protein
MGVASEAFGVGNLAGSGPEGGRLQAWAPETEGDGRARPEREEWIRSLGREWVGALEALNRGAQGRGIPVQAGSSELLASGVARAWGWGAPPAELVARRDSRPAPPEHGAWVLRVPPGCAPLLRSSIEASPALASGGGPSIHVEESALAHLPSEGWRPGRWPAPESWHRAARLLHPWTKPDRAIVPGDAGDLLEHLGRSVAPERVLLVAWDLWRGAVASETNRAAYWLARQAAGFGDGESARRWRRQAQEWGIRVLDPCPECGASFARRERNVIRLGLELPARVTQRSLFPARGLRRRRRILRAGSRAASAFFAPLRTLLATTLRLGPEGGNSSLSHRAFSAHNPRPAALRSEPVVTFRRVLREAPPALREV